MRKIEAVILDWAGTTVDFGSEAPVRAFAESFERFGMSPTLEEIRRPMGKLKRDHIHEMMEMPRLGSQWETLHGRKWNENDVDEIYAVSEKAIMEVLPLFTEPKPFVREAVDLLREKGIKIGSTTGYTEEMMEIVSAEAEKKGYHPDMWVTPDQVEGRGRPYPYMIFKNLEGLGIESVSSAVKIGDTAADIAEGRNAGLISVGVVEGSSVMGLSAEEYKGLSGEEKESLDSEVRKKYAQWGADYVIQNFSELEDLIFDIERNQGI